MKSIKTLAAIVLSVLSLTANAQSFVVVHKTDGTRAEYQTKDINKIEFLEKLDPYNGHEYVDLGLSVKWATMNIGASKREDYGNYYAWGETTTKSTYNWNSYKWDLNGTWLDQTKYTIDDGNTSKVWYENGIFVGDNKTSLEMVDDVAAITWGGSWRMPTREEQEELCTKCTHEWTSLNGKYGYKVTGPNGNYIFLPAAGQRFEGNIYSTGNYGAYWSSSLYSPQSSMCAFYLEFQSVWDHLPSSNNFHERYIGYSIRPVCP